MKKKLPDYGILFSVLVLLGIGIVMVYSSSSIKADQYFHDSYHFLKRQVVWAAVGTFTMMALLKFDYWNWKLLAKPIFLVNLALLFLVLIPGIGMKINEARRWIGFGFAQLQPSEIMKLSFVIFLAYWLSRAPEGVRDFWHGLVPKMALLGLVFGLIMAEPDMGTSIAISGTVVVMLFVSGAKLRHLAGLGASAMPLLGLLIWIAPYRWRRLTSFLNPEADPQFSGYQIIQSLYALGSGGLFGVGLGRSRQKFFYLPENHTDMIFAIIGEELGFIGGVAVILLFFFFAWRGFKVAVDAADSFGALLAVGITTMITLQAAINIGVVTQSMPLTGIPLPFISYGGSNLLFTLAGIGILLNVSQYTTR